MISDSALDREEHTKLTVFENLIKMLKVFHDNVSMLFQNRKRNENMEVAAQVVRPQALPESENVHPFKLTFVPDQQHAEKEEEIGRLGLFQVEV